MAGGRTMLGVCAATGVGVTVLSWAVREGLSAKVTLGSDLSQVRRSMWLTGKRAIRWRRPQVLSSQRRER